MQMFEGQYKGAALRSFVLGLGQSEAIIRQMAGRAAPARKTKKKPGKPATRKASKTKRPARTARKKTKRR